MQAIDFQRLSEYKLRRFRVEIGGFLTNAALSADFGAIKGPEGKERMPRTARCGRMLAEMRYGCLQNFYKYRTAPSQSLIDGTIIILLDSWTQRSIKSIVRRLYAFSFSKSIFEKFSCKTLKFYCFPKMGIIAARHYGHHSLHLQKKHSAQAVEHAG